MIVAIIPARGGSKRIPRKNVRLFCGKPLIAYPIEAAQASGLFDAIVVSTEDAAIAETARSFGAQTPFVRPANLADDHASTQPVLDHAIEWITANQGRPEAYCALYANPFITAETLRRGYAMLTSDPKILVVMGVTDFGYPIQRALRQTAAGHLEYMYPENAMARSQDLEPAYHDAAQFYWHDLAGIDAARARGEGVQGHALAIPRHLCQDIDTPEDWDVALRLYKTFFAEADQVGP